MRAVEVKEKSLTAQAHAVAGEIRKTKHELGQFDIRVNTFKEKLALHLSQSRNKLTQSPEILQSIANLKNSLSLQKRGQVSMKQKLTALSAQYEYVRTQSRKISERKDKLDAKEALAKEALHEDSLIELQATIRSGSVVNDKNISGLSPKINSSRGGEDFLITRTGLPTQEISIPVTRADGVAAHLKVSLIDQGKVSATIETQLSSASERDHLKRRMKRALQDQSRGEELSVEIEVL